VNGEIEETPKAGDTIFDKTFHLIIGSNILALKAAERVPSPMDLRYNVQTELKRLREIGDWLPTLLFQSLF
jgi:hypothetical protein